MQRLNLKLVIWLGAVGLITAVTMYFLHGFQMKRTAYVLLKQAQEADEAEGEDRDLEKAVNSYGQYLSYKQDDKEAATKHAFLLAELAELNPENRARYATNALSLLEEALRNNPGNDEIRERLVDFAVYAGRPQDSIEHIRTLLKQKPDDAELLAKLGACLVRTGYNREGVDTLRQAIEKGSTKVDNYLELAVTLRARLELPTEADKAIEDMVAANSDSAKAYLRRSQWLQSVQRPQSDTEARRVLDQINADIAKAIELEPNDADCLFAAAQIASQVGELEKAKEFMNKGHELHPKDERMVQMLVETAIKENKLDEVDELVKKMPDSPVLKQLQFEVKIQGADKEKAREILNDLDEHKLIDPRHIEYMRARMLIADGEWLKATREFERLRATMPGMKSRIDMVLGHCYEVLKQTDKQLEIYKSAYETAPTLEAIIGYGRALQAVGQNAEALAVFKNLKTRMKTEDFAKLIIARTALLNLLVEQQSRLPADQRNWSEVDELMAAAKAASPNANDLAMLESRIMEQKGDAAGAKEMIDIEIKKDPKSISPWLSLINWSFANEGAKGALKTIDDAEAALGDSYELRALRVSCAAQLPPEEAKEALAAATQWIDTDKTLKPEQKKQLRQLIGANYFRLREFGPARKVWQQIAVASPDDQQALLVLFDISINEQDDAKVVESIKAIKDLLGPDSAEGKYIDVRRNLSLLRAKKIDNPSAMLKDARKKIREAIELRPRWNALPRVEAEIDMFENRPDEAIVNLRKAMEFGATDYSVVRQLAELLTIRGRGPEAQQVLIEAQSRGPNKEVNATQELVEVSIELSKNNLAKAIELLEKAHTLDPGDNRKTVWLGQIMTKAARYDEAEVLFREAIEKDPNFPTTWQELVKLLRDQRRETDAREVVNLALEKIAKPQNELIAAQCCELLGDIDGAEQHAKKARDDQPDDLGLTRALAMFYARQNDPVKVRAELDRIMASKPATVADKEQIAWANREIAIMIASRGTYTDLKLALERLSENDANDKVTIAALLAGRPEAESRVKAVRLLEQVKASTTLTADSRLVLARLYDLTGNWPKAKDEMLSLVGTFKEDPKYLATLVEMLMDHNELSEAETWMAKIGAVAPGTPVVSAVRAKLFVKQGKPEQAVAVLRELLPRPMPKEMLPTLLQVAQLLESLQLHDAAEPMYREYSVLNPNGTLELAGFLGRHGSLKDALDLCESAMDNLPKDNVLRASIQVLRDKHDVASKEDYDRVARWISTASAKHPKSLLMKLIYAELLDLQQLYPELEEHYKTLLTNPEMVGPQRAIVLNNLAFLLAVQNRPGDAKKLIDEAIQIFGPTSDLLDTLALVEIAQKDSKQAITHLELATVDHPTGSKYFHLAQAHLMNKDPQAATDALKKAVETYKLNRKELAPAEQPKFDSMVKELGVTL